MTCYPHRSNILSNFIALCQPVLEISITKKSCGQRKKETVNDISPACLLACGDDRTGGCDCGDGGGDNWSSYANEPLAVQLSDKGVVVGKASMASDL